MLISELKIKRIVSELQTGDVSDYTFDIVNRLLFSVFDSGRQGDFIMVFGSPTCTLRRAPKAAELYLNGRAGKIILSGGRMIEEMQLTEAQAMKKTLCGMGVPENAIFLENKSMFTHENVEYSAATMNEISHGKPYHILAVSSEYHMRRVMMNFEHYKACFPAGASWSACPARSESAARENWHKTEKGRRIVAQQCSAIFEYVQNGYLPDEAL